MVMKQEQGPQQQGPQREGLNPQWAEEQLGIKRPRRFIVDSSVLEGLEEARQMQEYVKQHLIEYEFPDGLNTLKLDEECRALTLLDDFEAMYDVTMQLLEGRSVVIRMKDPGGAAADLCAFQVTDRFQNLRAVPAIDEYPCLILWLTEYMGAVLLKKYPVPLKNAPPPEARERKKGGLKETLRRKLMKS
jgi:hypothetical protein